MANLSDWPAGGEIDIIEGVNTDTTNHVALHSVAGVVVQSNVAQSGTFATTNCDASVAGNEGCGGYSAQTNSYGDGFNAAGGGVYAMDWQPTSIRVWHFPRASIPGDITSGNPNPNGWGQVPLRVSTR
jgi:hypothetical protein